MTEQQLLLNACNRISEALKSEFIKQGHHLTGEWEDNVAINSLGDNEVEIVAMRYGIIIDRGITPDRIPYGRPVVGEQGEGGISQYILGLARFWKLRKPNITDKQALKLAFATAEVQKIEGLSTEASKIYSSTGQRQFFMESVEVLFKDYLDNWIFEGFETVINTITKEQKVMYL
jgi:hypothetical protein